MRGMKRTAAVLILALLLGSVAANAQTKGNIVAHPQVRMETTEGTVVLELDTRRAPLSVANFLRLVESGFYDGTIFHRVVRNFVVQGGGHDAKFTAREDDKAVPNESGNGLSNLRGTIAMARTSDPHTANGQFFINLNDNLQLDPQPERWGYAVFGKVIEGMEAVDTMGTLPTGPGGPFPKDVPTLPIVVKTMTVVSP